MARSVPDTEASSRRKSVPRAATASRTLPRPTTPLPRPSTRADLDRSATAGRLPRPAALARARSLSRTRVSRTPATPREATLATVVTISVPHDNWGARERLTMFLCSTRECRSRPSERVKIPCPLWRHRNGLPRRLLWWRRQWVRVCRYQSQRRRRRGRKLYTQKISLQWTTSKALKVKVSKEILHRRTLAALFLVLLPSLTHVRCDIFS